jgi:hypothetical protein
VGTQKSLEIRRCSRCSRCSHRKVQTPARKAMASTMRPSARPWQRTTRPHPPRRPMCPATPIRCGMGCWPVLRCARRHGQRRRHHRGGPGVRAAAATRRKRVAGGGLSGKCREGGGAGRVTRRRICAPIRCGRCGRDRGASAAACYQRAADGFRRTKPPCVGEKNTRAAYSTPAAPHPPRTRDKTRARPIPGRVRMIFRGD